jgi:autotransporter-associated beta strand protein
MKPTSTTLRTSGALLLASLLTPWAYSQTTSFTGAYTQDFNGLIATGTVANSFVATAGTQAAIPALSGWSGTKVAGTGTTATAFTAGNGSANSGFLYSFGTTGSNERALGVIASGTNIFAFGAAFVNNSGHTVNSATIRFTAEFWRSSTAVKNTLPFAYGLSGGTATATNYLTDPSLTAATALDIVGPDPVASNDLLNGNVVPNRQEISVLLENLNWTAGTTLFIRWTDTNDGGNDAGLAVDDFFISEGVYVDPTDVSRGSANNVFAPASFSGAAFTSANNAVFDGTATTVNLSGAVVAKGLKFATDGYTLASPTGTDTLSLTGGRITVNSGVSAIISGLLVGTGGLEKTGPGTLVLSGANTFAGNVTIAGGRLEIANDSSLGDAANDLVFGGTLATSGSLSLPAGRTLSGTGTIETAVGGSLGIASPLAGPALAVVGASTVSLTGATNSVTSLSFAQPVALAIATGNLGVTSGLFFTQNTGTSTVAGGLNFGATATAIGVAGGTLTPGGVLTAALTGTNRISKTGLGTLDLSSTTFGGTGGFRLGVQGGFPENGGTLIVNDAGDLGTLQTQFNSGTIEAAVPLTFTTGLSIGGRAASSVARPTLSGANLTFSGASAFFAASGASGNLGLTVNNTTTLSGTFTPTTAPTGNAPAPSSLLININGVGTLIIGGDATTVLDRFFINGGATLVIAGTLGGEELNVDAGSTLSGGGAFTGARILANATTTPPVPELYRASTVTVYEGGTLAPTGTLALRSNLTLSEGSTAIFSINGPTIDTGYDSIDLSFPPVAPTGSSGTVSAYTLTYDGTLTLDFGATAANGDYSLFTTGANVSRTGSFDTVVLTGTYSGSLTRSGTAWSGTVGGKTFSFEENTGVLTVSGGVAPVEAWRSANFPGSTATTGAGADTADFDLDGLSNLLEYATDTDAFLTNTNAKIAGPSLVVASTVTNVGGTFLTLTFPKNPAATDVTYTVQATNDLGVTFTAGSGSTSVSGNTVTYTDNVPLNATNARRFLRLLVAY